ncbi:MAG: YfhO family protein [Firmicutes bacterium]|nr:YfhO family protein [Bacillota bacterium]
MEDKKNRRKERMKNFSNKFHAYIEETFSSKKKTFLLIAFLVFTVLFVIDILIILINNSFYNNFSDDVIQYYSIMCDFIAQVKDGTISWFNLNNYLGASIFSDVYYVPLDIFTFITFIFSYVMPTEIAYSTTELIKILAGVLIFAYYFSLQGMKNRTIFWMSMIYFISGGTVSFMAFPVFLSMVFYLPLSLVVIHFFFHKKRWIVPLFTMALIFYDFYLGYTVLAFISVMFLVEYFKRPNFRLLNFIKEGILFLGLLLLGVAMSLVILYPSVLYILQDTYRPEGTFDPVLFNFGPIEIELFQPEIYIRMLAKIFTEQKPIGFYGFTDDYKIEHVSLYISIIGFAYMSYIFFMRGRISKVYKTTLVVGLVFMIFPIFSRIFSGTPDFPYTRWINMFPIVMIMILAHVFDEFGFEKVKMKYFTISLACMFIADALLIIYYIKKLSLDVTYISRDVLTADTILMGVAGIVMILILIFGWMKKHKYIKWLFWMEFAIGIVYIYSGPFSIPNKIDSFQTMNSIDEYLNEVLDQDEFYRVYVDLERFDVEKFNFNRMTSFPTNTEIFHSWSDKETNLIGYLLFNTWEYQTKEKLEIQAIYLNQFLGYKYILVNSNTPYYFDSEFYQLKYANTEYQLYEILNSKPFQVYESYAVNSEYTEKYYNDLQSQKILLVSALIDAETYDTELLNLNNYELDGKVAQRAITAYSTIDSAEAIVTEGIASDIERIFYQYDNEEMGVNFDQGAIYIKVSGLNINSYGEVFMEFADGDRKACEIQPDQAHQVKCEFWEEPAYIYFEATEDFNSSKTLIYRSERAIDGAAYLVYDFSDALISDSGLLNYQIRNRNNNLHKTFLAFDRVFAVDDFGNEIESYPGYYYFESAPNVLYVFKTGDMYSQPDLFNLSLDYSFDDLSDYRDMIASSLSENESLTIAHSKINLSYDRISVSTYDQLIVIPVAYSEEWVFTSETKYETLSASGGFLGIIIPEGVNSIDIQLKFVPKGLKLGALGSLAGILIYGAIFIPTCLIERNKKKSKTILEMNKDEANNDYSSLI